MTTMEHSWAQPPPNRKDSTTETLPPAYDESHAEAVPEYNSLSDISARWHIANTPAKGLFGSRGISLLHDSSAVTSSISAAAQDSKTQGYNLVFTDSLHLQVYEITPTTGPGSSNAKGKAPVLAEIYFATGNPAKANVTFVTKDKTTLTIDAQDIFQRILPSETTDRNEPIIVALYLTMVKNGQMPVCWSMEANKSVTTLDQPKPASDNKGESASYGNEVIKEEPKRSWRDSLKDKGKDKEKDQEKIRAQAMANAKLLRSKQDLGSHFKLRDASGNVYAHFTNELFVDAPHIDKLPEVTKEYKQQRSWGYLDIHDPQLTCLRTSFSQFEKWTEKELELLVLLTLVMTLEINLKINGGKEGNIFNKTIYGPANSLPDGAYTMDVPTAISFGLGRLARGGMWLGRLADGASNN